MKQNKLILFDWGNIVESFETGYNLNTAFDDLFKYFGYNETGVAKKLGKYQVTKIKTMEELEQCYLEMKKEFNLNGTFEEFIEKYDYFFNKIEYYKDVRDYEVSLKNRCYIGVLSNLMIIDKKRIDKQLGLDNYDYLFLSFEYGMKKPDMEFYEAIQESLPFNKEDILFIDDKERNVEAAKKFGWNAYVLTGLQLDKIKEVCEEFLKR